MTARDANRGVFFEIVDARNVKLVGVHDVPTAEESAMPEPLDPELSEQIANAALDAPLVVRVEVASLSLSAEAFANLKPGDIVATEQPLGQLSTLRVAGREVARGELVNIDGELGVRIRTLIRRP
jgi:flagellar motor switch/type III secretory pathway protein FliN